MKTIDWKKLATSKEMGIWGGLMALILLLALQNYILPLNSNYNDAASQLSAKKIEMKSYESRMKAKPAEGKNAGKMDVGKQSVARKVKELFDQSNTTVDVVTSELVAELTKPEYEKLAHLEKYNFGDKVQNPGYSQKDFEIKLSGTYDGIAEYLGSIHRFSQLLKIESIDVKPLDQEHRDLVLLVAKGILYISDLKAAPIAQFTTSRSDTAADILIELNRTRTSKFPFAKKTRDSGVRSIRDLVLTSTLAGSAHPSALISGKSYSVGDEVAEFRLKEVHPQEVVLQRGDVEVVLKMSDKGGVASEDKVKSILRRAESTKSLKEAPEDGDTGDSKRDSPSLDEKQNIERNEPNEPNEKDEKAKDILKPHSEGGGAGASGGGSENSGGGGASNEGEQDRRVASSGSENNNNDNSGSDNEGQDDAKKSELLGPAGNRQEGNGNNGNDGNSFISGNNPEQNNPDTPGGGGAGGGGTPGKRKLKPSEVEDIAGVPFEDLEDPLENLWG